MGLYRDLPLREPTLGFRGFPHPCGHPHTSKDDWTTSLEVNSSADGSIRWIQASLLSTPKRTLKQWKHTENAWRQLKGYGGLGGLFSGYELIPLRK